MKKLFAEILGTFLLVFGGCGSAVLAAAYPELGIGFGEHSPNGCSLVAVFIAEVVLTAFFLIIIHGVTDKIASAGFAPIAIGLALTLIHLISIPVSNTSVNPARSTAVAVSQLGT